MRRMALSVGLAGIALCGCADFSRATRLIPAPVNPESPIAPAAIAASRENYAYPRFSQVPPRPKDLPTPAQLKTTVVGVAHERRDVIGWTGANPAMVGDTDSYAAKQKTELAPEMIQPVDPAHAGAMEAYAAKQREAAAPPPPLRNGPPPQPLTPPGA